MTKPLVTKSRNLSLLVLGWPYTWDGAYIPTMLSRGDRPSYREGSESFNLAWSFQAGELPGFIWLLNLVGFALPADALGLLERRRALLAPAPRVIRHCPVIFTDRHLRIEGWAADGQLAAESPGR